MTDHNEEKDAFEAALNQTAVYRGVKIGLATIVRKGPIVSNPDGTITGATFEARWQTSAEVKALIDAKLDATTPPAPPATDPPAPPAPAAGTLKAAFTATVDGATVHIADSTTGAVKEQWSWGDGGTSVVMGDQNKTYRYAKAYTITLIAWDAAGKTSKATASVTTTADSGPAAPPPAAPSPPGSPAPPPGSAPVPAASVHPGPVPVSPVGSGPHVVFAKVRDRASGKVWSATAQVGDDRTASCLMACLVDETGAPHPALMLQAYADKCHVHAARMDNAHDYLGFDLEVTYDGAPADVPPSSYADGSYDFWVRCWHPSINYGEQEPFNLANVDRSMAPAYAGPSQAPVDTSKFDFTWNGVGGTTITKMGTTGERGEIGYLQQAYMTFWLDATAENWELVKKIERYCCNWNGVFALEPTTGGVIRYTDYAMATTLPPAQAAQWQAGNPVADYGGSYRGDELTLPATGWVNGGSPFEPNTAHLTGYGLSGMIERTRHNQDLLSFWANYCFIDQGPSFTRSQGFVLGAQRRFAWALRSVFMAAYYSSDQEYFDAELDRNLAIANAWPKNPLGILDTYMGYVGKGGADGYTGYAQWMQNYVAMVLAPVALKRPEWADFARYVGTLYVTMHAYPFAMCGTVYGLMVKGPDGKLLEDFPLIIQKSLENAGWTEEHALAAVNASTVEECYAAAIADSMLGGRPAWGGKCVNGVADYIGYLNSPSSYPIATKAAVISSANVGTPGIEQAVQIAQNQPTPIDCTKNRKYDLALTQGFPLT